MQLLYSSGKKHQQDLISGFLEKNDGLVLAGDGRCYSPGYSVKFDSFTLIEQRINRVVDFQLVQVWNLDTKWFKAFMLWWSIVNAIGKYHYSCNVTTQWKSSFFGRVMRLEIAPRWSMKGWWGQYKYLPTQDSCIVDLITDRHKPNTTSIERNLPNTTHYLDIWKHKKGRFCVIFYGVDFSINFLSVKNGALSFWRCLALA